MKVTRFPLILAVIAAVTSAMAMAPAGEPGASKDGFVARVILSNPSSFERPDENIVLSFAQLGLDIAHGETLRVVGDEGILPSQQVDFDGDGTPDSLIFNAGFDAAASRTVQINRSGERLPAFTQRAQAEISIKQGGAWEDRKYIGGQFVNVDVLEAPPQHTDHSEFIRYEGPGIESDLVGYRVYLDWRNGFDIFGKKVTDMVLQNVGQDGYGSYHEAADWGMDVLKVGDAAGMGGYGSWDGERLHRVADVEQRSVRILDSGPLFAQLEILYEGWLVDDRRLDLSARLSMQAGSRLVHTQLALSENLDAIAVGIVRHPDTEFLQGDLNISGHAWTYVASWGKQSLAGDQLGMMLLFPRQDLKKQLEDDHNYVSVLQPRGGRLEYYFGAVWEQEPGGVDSVEAFRALLEREAEKLTLPLRLQLQTAKTRDAIAAGTSALEWSQRLASSEIARNGDDLAFGGFDRVSNRPAAWRYTTGLLALALDDLSLVGAGPQYAEWARRTIDSYITKSGEIRTYQADEYNIDKINSGKMVLRLYERTGEEKYRRAADALRAQLADHPRTSGGAFWHKQRYPWQLWLDGVYMGMPFLAHYAQLTGDETALEEAVAEFQITRAQLRDPETGLYFHAWDEKAQQDWANPETGLSSHFWSRGMGWYAMALVDVLDFIPADRPDLREPLIAAVVELADALLAFRGPTGWWQITDRPDEVGNYLEASASSMFVYMLAKAVNRGYLGQDYAAPAATAWNDLVRTFINVEADGSVSLENVCAVAGLGFGRDGSYHYYMSEPVIANDPKGTGPFIMAGVQIAGMLDQL